MRDSVVKRPVDAYWAITTGALVAMAAVLLGLLASAVGATRLAFDFRDVYLPAAEAVLAGGSPYDPVALGSDLPYVYSPLLAELLVPLTILPVSVASALAALASLAAIWLALAVVGVRDARCYGAVVVWAPGWNAVEMANVSAALALALALLWRHRDAWPRSGFALGVSLALKPILSPLLLWLAVTRRVHAAVLAVGVAGALVLASWSAIGFAGLFGFPERLGEVDFEDSYSLVGMSVALGVDPWVGRVAMIVTGSALLVAAAVLGRRGDEFASFLLATVAALALVPVVWLHYIVLLAVPLAISRPRFALLWLLPIVLWMCPRAGNGDGIQPFVPALVVAALVAGMLVCTSSRGAGPH